MQNLEKLSTDELLSHVDHLVAVDREVTADILAALVEIDERRLYLALGFSSLHAWCVERLGFSDDVACKRIRVARAAKVFPEIIDIVRAGGICPSGLSVLAPHLGEHPELLDEAIGMTLRQIDALVANRVPDARAPMGYQRIRPVGPGRYKVEIVLSEEQMRKLEVARDLCRHRNPEGDLAVIVEQGFDLLIAKVEKGTVRGDRAAAGCPPRSG
jgi:hypothetical protein